MKTGPVLFMCRSCARPVAEPEGRIGQRTPCPHCGAALLVPQPSILFACPYCRQEHRAPLSAGGLVFECTACRGKLRVPAGPTHAGFARRRWPFALRPPAVAVLAVAGLVLLLALVHVWPRRPPAAATDSRAGAPPSPSAAPGDGPPTGRSVASLTNAILAARAEMLAIIRDAAAGRVDAQYGLGLALCEGRDMTQDYREAFRWFEQAARQEHVLAEYRAGVCTWYGLGTPRDPATAVRFWAAAAQKGHAESQFNLGMCYLEGTGAATNETEGIYWIVRSADRGCDEAKIQLAMCLIEGRGIPRDEARAVRLLRDAAAHNHGLAWRDLGVCHLRGIGVREDPGQAADCLERAEKAGCPAPADTPPPGLPATPEPAAAEHTGGNAPASVAPAGADPDAGLDAIARRDARAVAGPGRSRRSRRRLPAPSGTASWRSGVAWMNPRSGTRIERCAGSATPNPGCRDPTTRFTGWAMPSGRVAAGASDLTRRTDEQRFAF